MMSFHATKIYHTLEGGALMCRDERLKNIFDLMRNFGIADEESVLLPGLNGKMNELQAAVGLIMLDYVEGESQKRAALQKVYVEELSGCAGRKSERCNSADRECRFDVFVRRQFAFWACGRERRIGDRRRARLRLHVGESYYYTTLQRRSIALVLSIVEGFLIYSRRFRLKY